MDEGRRADDATQLRSVVAALEEEIAVLRRRVRDAPARVEDLENELSRMRERLDRAMTQNDKLSTVLEEAREQLGVLREEVEKLTSPPNNFGTVTPGQRRRDASTSSPATASSRVAAQPNVEVKLLQKGQEVLLNESFTIIDIRHFDPTGEVVRVREMLDDGRLVVIAHADEEKVVQRAESMTDVKLRPGDFVRIDPRAGLVVETTGAARGRRTGSGGDPRYHLRARRRSGRSDRRDPRRGRAALPAHRIYFAIRPRRRPRASSSTALPAAARLSSPRPWPTASPRAVADRTGQPGRPLLFPQHQRPRAPQQVGRRDRAPDPPDLPTGQGEVGRRRARHRLLRRDGLPLPHHEAAASAPTSNRPSCPSSCPSSTGWSR